MELADKRPTVVIVGGGFGGLWTARALRKAPVRVILVDRLNHHVFQPLLYQVATAGLSPADIAQPIRSILRGQPNLEVLLAEVVGVDTESKEVLLGRDRAPSPPEHPTTGTPEHPLLSPQHPAPNTQHLPRTLPYDFLILATGVRHSYFGHDDWERFAPGLKTLDDATAMRSRILIAFERAESAESKETQAAWLTFVVVGGGPTGVELAGAIAEIAFRSMAKDFDHIDPKQARIILIEAGPRLLPAFPIELSEATSASLGKMGVEVQTSVSVKNLSEGRVETSDGAIEARTVLWAAGNLATPVAKWLDTKADRMGRVLVEPDCSVPGQPEVFVIGDAMTLPGPDGQPLPGVAQVAMQQGDYVARAIASRISLPNPSLIFAAQKRGRGLTPFRYRDKGVMATIGRRQAVCVIGGRQFRGFLAWFLWLTIHIWYLIGFRNKLLVLIQWAWSYLTFQRGARLITGLGRK